MREAARPILGASLACFRDGRVLIARRGRGAKAGLWSLPGGRIEFGETAADAATREFLEETSARAETIGFAGYAEMIDEQDGHHFVVLAFAGRLLAGEPATGPEASEIAWVAPDDIGGFETTEGLARIVALAAEIAG